MSGQVVEIGELALLEASCPFAIPSHRKAPVVQLRARISSAGDLIASNGLRDFEFETLELYHEIFTSPPRATQIGPKSCNSSA